MSMSTNADVRRVPVSILFDADLLDRLMIAAAAGAIRQAVIRRFGSKTGVLSAMAARMNAAYSKVFVTHKPARACYEVSALPKGRRLKSRPLSRFELVSCGRHRGVAAGPAEA